MNHLDELTNTAERHAEAMEPDMAVAFALVAIAQSLVQLLHGLEQAELEIQ